jgi:hypothetical protein
MRHVSATNVPKLRFFEEHPNRYESALEHGERLSKLALLSGDSPEIVHLGPKRHRRGFRFLYPHCSFVR